MESLAALGAFALARQMIGALLPHTGEGSPGTERNTLVYQPFNPICAPGRELIPTTQVQDGSLGCTGCLEMGLPRRDPPGLKATVDPGQGGHEALLLPCSGSPTGPQSF